MTLPSKDLYQDIKSLLQNARSQVMRAVNTTMVHTYYEIGRLIVEHEQKGQEKAEYGKGTLKQLSDELTQEFGKGFSLRNIETMRKFYLTYRKTQTPSAELEKSETLSRKFDLSWSHYVFLMRLDERERKFYELESIENNWSLRELKRQFDTALFDRLRLSKDKEGVKALNAKGQIIIFDDA